MIKNAVTNLGLLSCELYLTESKAKDRETRELLSKTRLQIDQIIIMLNDTESELDDSQFSEFIRSIPMIYRIIEMLAELKDSLLFYTLLWNFIYGFKSQGWEPPPGGSHVIWI